MNIEINSKENQLYKEIKKLQTNKSNYLYVEGNKLFLEAVKSNLNIEKIIISQNNIEILSKIQLPNTEIILMNNDLIASLFTTNTKPLKEDLIISIVKYPSWSKDEIFASKKNLIFLERIQDPGNLGTIIRSSLAFNAGGIILSSDSVSPTNTKVIRSSAGSVFSLPIISINNSNELHEISKVFSYSLIALVKEAGKSLKNKTYTKNNIFLFGNEGKGLSQEVLKLSNDLITIPQSDKVESLNLATSVSIILWDNYISQTNN